MFFLVNLVFWKHVVPTNIIPAYRCTEGGLGSSPLKCGTVRGSPGNNQQLHCTPTPQNFQKGNSFSFYTQAFYFSYLLSINSLLFETMQLTIFPILVLSACVVTAQVLSGDSAQSVITELVEDQKYLIRLPTGDIKWVTEADKWRLREVTLVFFKLRPYISQSCRLAGCSWTSQTFRNLEKLGQRRLRKINFQRRPYFKVKSSLCSIVSQPQI
jgi:hypothetical protein